MAYPDINRDLPALEGLTVEERDRIKCANHGHYVLMNPTTRLANDNCGRCGEALSDAEKRNADANQLCADALVMAYRFGMFGARTSDMDADDVLEAIDIDPHHWAWDERPGAKDIVHKAFVQAFERAREDENNG